MYIGTPYGGRRLREMMNAQICCSYTGEYHTHTVFEGFHWSTASKGIHRLGNSDLVSRASDTGSLPASNGNHDMMAQVDFASTVLAAKTLAFDTNILFHDVKPACTSSGTVSICSLKLK